MCIANLETVSALIVKDEQALTRAIDGALTQSPQMREVLAQDIDSAAIAFSCADRSTSFARQLPGIAAVLLLAAEAIRRERAGRLLAEFQAELNQSVIKGRSA